jgi:hypothetical protein
MPPTYIVGSKPEKRARHEAQVSGGTVKPRSDRKKEKRPPVNFKGSTQTSSRPLKLYSEAVKSNKLLSKPWGDREIRLLDSDVKATLNRSLWKIL